MIVKNGCIMLFRKNKFYSRGTFIFIHSVTFSLVDCVTFLFIDGVAFPFIFRFALVPEFGITLLFLNSGALLAIHVSTLLFVDGVTNLFAFGLIETLSPISLRANQFAILCRGCKRIWNCRYLMLEYQKAQAHNNHLH